MIIDRRYAFRVCLATLVVVPLFATASSQNQTPTFRMRTEGISVNVSVKRGKQAVPGLSADDFILFDNGTTQSVVAASVGTFPLDVTFLYGTGIWPGGNVQEFRTDIGNMAQMLSESDRVRVLEYGSGVAEVIPLQPVRRQSFDTQLNQSTISPTYRTGGWTALNDGLTASLIVPASPDRRQLVIVFYESFDTLSVISLDKLKKLAATSEVVLHLQLFQRKLGTTPREVLGPFPFYLSGISVSDRQALSELALMTGGTSNGGGVFGRQSLLTFFRGVLDDYRKSYVLHYVPAPAPAEGWHTLEVKIKRPGRYDVRARRGYFVGAER